MSTDTSLPRLRRDLRLHQGPRLRDGSPTLTIEDPLRGHYFRLGWAEAEILSRWGDGNAASMAEKISGQTTLQMTESDVLAFVDFLKGRQLIETGGGADTDRLIRIAASQQIGWLRWLLHNYLFLRIPLVRPDRFLDRTMGWVRPLTSRLFLMATLIAGLAGLAMAVRQWDSFLHTFLYFFTLEGAAAAGVTLIMVKVLHELGHAYACKHYGCRVPTMGVALLVLWPVLYTDTTAAWRLTQRHQRLVIGAAGMMTELVVAVWATLAWSFLPDGVLRSAAFTLATTTWILTLAVNLSPLMRFDGYFLLSDLLDVPNLQPRAFALARWRLRNVLFGVDDPPPEHFEPWLRLTLLVYAYATWVYRFFLFLGIALLVYHFAFKVLGVVLFSVEIVCFILLPIQREVRDWWHRRRELSMNRHTLITGTCLLLFTAFVIVPWRDRVEAPALLRAGQQAILVMPVGGQLREVAVTPGQTVAEGQVLFRLGAPDQEHALAQLDREIAILRDQSRYQHRDERENARQQVAGQELEAALRRRVALAGQRQQLEVSAAFQGRVADIATPLRPGEWLPQGEWLATVIGPDGGKAEAFVTEHDLERLTPGAIAWFVPEDPSHPRRELRVEDIARTASRTLDAVPELASPYQGDIAAHADRDHTLVPTQAMYRVLLTADGDAPERTLRGTVSIDARSSSLLAQLWRSALAVLARELSL